MPVKRTKADPPHEHPELVSTLADELTVGKESGKQDAPKIIQEEQTFGENLHVTVFWEKWLGIPAEERGAIILDAYKSAQPDDFSKITMALGLTNEEAKRLGIKD